MAPYLITYCLFLLRETSKSFHACAYESSDGPLLGSAVNQKKKRERGEDPFSFVIYICHYREKDSISIAKKKHNRQNKKLALKKCDSMVNKMTNYLMQAHICSRQTPGKNYMSCLII